MKSLKNLALITLGALTLTSGNLFYFSNKNHNLDNEKNKDEISKVRQEKIELTKTKTNLEDTIMKNKFQYISLAMEHHNYMIASYDDKINLQNLEEEYFDLNKDYDDILNLNLQLIWENVSLTMEKEFYKNLSSRLDSMLINCQKIYDAIPENKNFAFKE